MHTIDINRGENLLVTIKPDDTSTWVKRIMGEDQLNITFKDNRYIPFAINDWCEVFGAKYTLASLPVVRKVSTYLWEYTMVLDSQALDLKRTQFLFLGADNTLRESSFSLMGNADKFLQLVVDNVNRVNGGWEKGQVINSEYKNLTFSKENCFSALGRIAEAFQTEFWVEGKTIHLTTRARDTGYLFKHGRNKGLYEITRLNVDNSSVVTRLYAFGSDKNLPADYRDYVGRLLMPNGDYYVEKNTDTYGVIEATELFDDVYPRRTGKVTAVNAGNPFVFVDANMDFDLNDQLLPGVSAKVVFNTGQLAGYEFEVSAFNNGTKQFTILKNKNERRLEVPSTTLRPVIGDEYVLVDIKMPDSYIEAAEAELKEKALALLEQVSEPQVKYAIVIDPVFIKRSGWVLNVGDLVWVKDAQLGLQRKIRVVQVTRNLINEHHYQIEISDINEKGTFTALVSATQSTSRDLSNVRTSLINNSILNNTAIGDLKVQQGSIVIEAIPETSTDIGFSPVYVDNATGKLYRLV